MDSTQKVILWISGIVLVAANIMIAVYGLKLVISGVGLEPSSIDPLGLGWYFWFFVLLTITFDACYIIGVLELKKSKR